MATWIELGEVPDSEDEDGFDSQNVEDAQPQPLLMTMKAATKSVFLQNNRDIWDFPDSDDNGDDDDDTRIQQSRPPDMPLSPTAPGGFDSSPLSSAPSDEFESQTLFQNDSTPKVTPILRGPSLDVVPQPDGAILSPIEVRLTLKVHEDHEIVQSLTTVEEARDPTPDSESNLDSEGQGARQIAMRHERSLRPRKPIQEHPYLLENAHYSTFLRAHGVKPLRMAVEPVQETIDGSIQDADFEGESQEEVPPPGEGIESQRGDTSFTIEEAPDSFPPSSPPNPPSVGHQAQNPILPNISRADDNSIFDQDLPDLEHLLNLRSRPKIQAPKLNKRKASKAQSATLKRQRQYEAPSVEPLGSADPMNIGCDVFSHGLTPLRGSSVDEYISPVARSPEQTSRVHMPVTDIPFSEESSQEVQDTLVSQETSATQSESENEELVTKIGRRIRGVLPASWLRLDHQSTKEKPHQSTQKKQQQQRSPGKETRRGVAQPKHRGVNPTPARLLFEESDEEMGKRGEEASSTDQRTTDEIYHHQTRSDFQSVAHTTTPEPLQDPFSSDDALSLIEEDSIDLMLPRQDRLPHIPRKSDKNGKGAKNLSSSHTHLPVKVQKKPKQPRITSLLQKTKGSNSARSPAAEGRQKHRQGRRANHVQKPKLAPPHLSILDVIQADAPRFIRIAARTAKRRPNQGRSSVRRKSIKLASREDNVDTISVLEDWRSGLIKQRAAVSLASQAISRPQQHPHQPLSGISGVVQDVPKIKPRKLMRYVSQGGSVSYRQNYDAQIHPARKLAMTSKSASHALLGPARPAQLEMTETEQPIIRKFDSLKKRLDRSFRKQNPGRVGAESVRSLETDLEMPSKAMSTETQSVERSQNVLRQTARQTKANSFHKRAKPRRIDVQAPQYTHADDPLPMQYHTPCPEPSNPQMEENKLQGLGPYGTQYTHHFEIFPLDSGVYFHESTLIGSGVIDACFNSGLPSKISNPRPRVFFNLGEHVLRWGPWDDRVSSELGITFDFIADQVRWSGGEGDEAHFPDVVLALDATSFVFRYLKDALSLDQHTLILPFVTRLNEVLSMFCSRVKPDLQLRHRYQQTTYDSILKIFDRVLLISFLVLRICQTGTPQFDQECQTKEVLMSIAHMSISMLKSIGNDRLRETYQATARAGYRERGLRNNDPVVHSWTLLLKILELAQTSRSPFWDVLGQSFGLSSFTPGFHIQDHEQIWETLFTLLPLTEFNSCGIIVPEKRHETMTDGWVIPRSLLEQVFKLYRENQRQAPSFNNYCRALVGRCHFLLKHWGWHESAPVIGVIFDFFGSQNFAHLRNEEVYRSPQFLEELAKGPSLDLGPDDRCFHIFLKLLALSICKLKKRGSERDIRNLVARTIPNHNYEYSKEQNVHERDLAALRNQHDLIVTLYWACPLKLRPSITLLERLVAAETSHKEACLINIRAWNQLARFTVSSGEATSFPRYFGYWRNSFFQEMMQQFDAVASDIQQQFSLLSKDDRMSISEDRIRMTISMNKKAIKEILSASLAASLDVMRHAPDLEAASFCFGTPQLQQVFNCFIASPPELGWPILRTALATLDTFLSKIKEFKDKEESQENESQMLRSAQADDALMVIDNDLSRGFFLMASSILSSHGEVKQSMAIDSDRHWCVEEVLMLAARIGTSFIHGGSMRISDLFKTGKYGLFDGLPKSLDLAQRRYLAFFMSELLKQGFDDFTDANFSLVEVWVLSLVKPQAYLKYENQFAEQLQRRGQEFVSDALEDLSIRPNYSSNRDLFEFAIAWLRRSIRDAGPSSKKVMTKEYAGILESVMSQIKGDLKFVLQDTPEHGHYVIFVREIISLIKVHGSDICAIDDFFYKMSKEYSPSTNDPQLHVAGMVSYGLRLQEGDMKVAHQLFYLLFNNFKFALMKGNLDDDVKMLLKGLKHRSIFSFVLGKMLPSIIRACFANDSAFVLLDVYVQALNMRMTKNVVAFELNESDLPLVAVIQRASIDGIDQMSRSSSTLSLCGAQTHVLRQTMALMNLFWPSLFVLSMSQPQASCWKEILESMQTLLAFAMVAQRYLSRLSETADEGVQKDLLFGGFTGSTTSKPFDIFVNNFTKDILDDTAKNWVTRASRICIQVPGTQATDHGVETPVWDFGEIIKDLHNETQEWIYWASKLSGSPERLEGGREPLFM